MLVGIAGIEADLKDANLGGARLNEADLSVFRHGLPANYAPDFANAMCGYGVAFLSGSPWLGVLVAGCAGTVLGSVHAALCSLPRVNDIALGIAIMLFGTGLAFYLGKPLANTGPGSARDLTRGNRGRPEQLTIAFWSRN